jgi:hypothetical protein
LKDVLRGHQHCHRPKETEGSRINLRQGTKDITENKLRTASKTTGKKPKKDIKKTKRRKTKT